MSSVPDELRYTKEHEYVRVTDDADVVEVGITDYAQGELGDIVFVELPKVGERFDQSQVFGTIEAVKAVSDLYSPVSGEIVAVNEAIDPSPGTINTDPYGEGWMVRIRLDDPSQLDALMDAGAYQDLID